MTTTGCMCCTASSDINQSLLDLSAQRVDGTIGPFRRVIVETTGLMDPVPVIAALLAPPAGEQLNSEFALARVVTLFDIVNGSSTLDHHEEARKQVALSDVLLLTKTDLAQDPASRRDIVEDRQRLSGMNSGAIILDRHSDWLDMRAMFLSSGTYDLRDKDDDAIAWLNAEFKQPDGDSSHSHGHHHGHSHDHNHNHLDHTRHGDDIRSHVIIVDDPVSPVVFSFFLDAVRMIAGTDLLRLKGLVALSDDADRPLVVHGVQHLIHPVERLPTWPSDDRRSKIVLIGRDLKVDALRAVLNPEGAAAS